MGVSDRYSRQERFQPLGAAGQRRLAEARVVIVGCGALGSFHAMALARAGVGYLRLLDRDFVELNNLQRQWLYDEADAEQALPKAVAAKRHLGNVNSEVRIDAEIADLTAASADELLGDTDLVLDGADNFETRYLVNDWCVKHSVPWVYGAAVGSYGLTMPVLPGETPCLKCLYPEPPSGVQPTCETAGVLNAVTAMVGAWQVSAAIQLLSGHRELLPRRITSVDVWTGAVRQVPQSGPQPDCMACAQRRFIHLDGRSRTPISLCGRNAVQIHERARPLDLNALAAALAPLGRVRVNEFALRFSVDPYEMTVFPDGRAIIHGTQDVGLARSLYARFIGA